MNSWKKWLIEIALKAFPFILEYILTVGDYAVDAIGADIRAICEAVEKSNVGENKWQIVKKQAVLLFPNTADDIINRAIELAVAMIKAQGKEIKK